MPKRLAITISGAVSLGSYEAGVLYEVITAIGQHNGHSDTTPEEHIEIDVLTGASAGGMTATIAAQKLMFEAAALKGAFTNSFYTPWVADVSLDGLLNIHPCRLFCVLTLISW
jgi:predicted acylesterase/phospholipase RssA